MSNIEIESSDWTNVQVGRMVRFRSGPQVDKIACIVDIIDHKRVLVENPSENSAENVPRHAAFLSSVQVDKLIVENVTRGVGHGPLKRAMTKAGVMEKFNKSDRCKKTQQIHTRRKLSDFERFKVMILKKQARMEVRKSFAAVRKSAKA